MNARRVLRIASLDFRAAACRWLTLLTLTAVARVCRTTLRPGTIATGDVRKRRQIKTTHYVSNYWP